MESDNPVTESTGPLSLDQAASLFNGETPQEEPEKAEQPAAEVEAVAEHESVVDDPAQVEETFTIEVDGKTVELTKAQMAENYKNGLRQADYTKKTMATAEKDRAAEAELAKARHERQQYADGLIQAQTLLQAGLQEQNKIDWDALLQQDPQEYLKQKHLFERRQAALQEARGRLGQVQSLNQQEHEEAFFRKLQTEQQEVLAKLPEWKDPKKAADENDRIVKDLVSRGFDMDMVVGRKRADGRIDPNAPGITDHKLLLLARDAMLYRETMSKAQTAAKKVSQLPQKVERPGGGERNPLDGRTAEVQRFMKSGALRDAGAAFGKMFK